MKRIMSACLQQTIKFDTLKDTDPKEDFQRYLKTLERKGQAYKILETKNENDGSIIVKLIKQYNSYSAEGYLD